MIRTPEIPTDNLYKFISIFGLVIFIFSIYLFVDSQRNFDLSIKKFQEKGRIELLRQANIESKKLILNDRITHKKIKMALQYDISNPSSLSSDDYLKIKDSEKFERDFNELKKLELESLLLQDDINKKKDSFDKNDIEFYSPWPISLLSMVGIILIIVGFSLWYFRTQKYYDQEIKKMPK